MASQRRTILRRIENKRVERVGYGVNRAARRAKKKEQ